MYFDDEAYDLSHGHVYRHLGIDPAKGVVVVVRPDQCKFPSRSGVRLEG